MTVTNVTAAIFSQTTLGWVPGCATRGTFDIIWSCVQTILLCAWVSVCTNLPAPKGGKWDIMTDKVFFTILTLMGPEFVFCLAFCQWQCARASIAEFEQLGYRKDEDQGYEGWTLTHGFYANMGGIRVQPKYSEEEGESMPDFATFPVTARQLAWLIKHEYIEGFEDPKAHDPIRQITRENIMARGKVDFLAKTVTIVQALNFFITTIARLATGLAVTTLELTVLANISCTFAAYIAWWHKPTDIEFGHDPFPLKVSTKQLLEHAGPGTCEYYHTPLDFVDRDDYEWPGSLIWCYWVNILRILKLLHIFPRHYERPSQRLTSFDFPRPSSLNVEIFLLVVSLAYTAWFLGAWHFYFPSADERIIWRTVSVTQIGLGLVSAIHLFSEDLRVTKRRRSTAKVTTQISRDAPKASPNATAKPVDMEKGAPEKDQQFLSRLVKLWNMQCNNDRNKHPFRDIPLRLVLIMTPMAAAYVLCRWIILVEDVISLRSQPASAYRNVNWTPYWPWF